ncbi:MAG: 2Fe-2S iron-sulfur cluster-binding protein [Capsulimonadaceae bacterium]
MPTITVEGATPFVAESGKKLVLAIEDAGIDILHRCGGFARCTTCRVCFIDGEPEVMGSEERETLEEDELLGTYRLSCQIRIGDADMSVRVVNRSSAAGVPPGYRPED